MGGVFDFYPRPPRGGRQLPVDIGQTVICISTHALREEGDVGPAVNTVTKAIFLPTPSARRATQRRRLKDGPVAKRFLPTPSARRATFVARSHQYNSRPFLPTPSARRATPAAEPGRPW